MVGGGQVTPTWFFIFPLCSWVEIRLHTENQLLGLPGSGLKVCVVGYVQTNYFVELSCDNRKLKAEQKIDPY